ncbi:Sulfotransferase family protein [Jatrophihabitans endophyticus]|uniref:Sulfotransferase family protein n=1 Tax=Jatrophihabitans endophyticus TaxID=1206085 RepID=A0A1M5KKJ4_9ACTN|nr:sulfotransferase [Jatrophihabitans endophyticus]SHG53276.1 Sulfotransferase family protein [Jatrophihabitans endophyticus]
MSDRPIFIVGCPRSGTTLLSTMLHAHPRIAIPPETRFLLPAYHDRAEFGDLTERANRRRLAKRITGKGSKFRDLGLDKKRTIKRIVNGPPTLGSAAGIVWREFARSRGKVRWGEKRPAYWREMDVVLRLFPDAQIVHLVRDGRACVSSLNQVEWWGRGSLGSMTTWALADQQLRRLGRRLPDGAYHYLRYEDLLADPVTQLSAVCGFLGEDFDEAMLDRTRSAADIVPTRKTWHDRVRGQLDPTRIEAWRTALTPQEIGLFEYVAGRALRANGYEPSGIGERPSPLAVARYTQQYVARRVAITKRRADDAVQRRREQVPLADLGR